MGNTQPELWDGRAVILFIVICWIALYFMKCIWDADKAVNDLTPEEKKKFGIIEEFEEHYYTPSKN